MNRYDRYDEDYPLKYRLDYIQVMCLLEELWEE